MYIYIWYVNMYTAMCRYPMISPSIAGLGLGLAQQDRGGHRQGEPKILDGLIYE